MTSLTERIEAATGPDHALDCMIAIATGAVPEGYVRGHDYHEELPYWWKKEGLKGPIWQAPNYTASLDAALTLVPDNCGIVLHSPIGKRPSAAIQGAKYPGHQTADGWGDYASGSTAALALCGAALRARGVS